VDSNNLLKKRKRPAEKALLAPTIQQWLI